MLQKNLVSVKFHVSLMEAIILNDKDGGEL